jgi:leucyl-tRNA synthetase
MHSQYTPKAIESALQAHWANTDAYRAIENNQKYPKGKYYCVSMLPYPSGKLHMGHVRNYTINDVMVRQRRMQGYNVLMPMGWDAFGLPAENAAMKNKVAPAKWTYDNIAYMKQQMNAMGLSIDWSREATACKPDYYRWNQWMFLQMLKHGIAYRKTQTVNWDPVDQTVLANEQVIDGKGWRTGALVEKREIPGYYLSITKYAGELLDQLDKMQGWPERVRIMQENWIGKSIGVRFAFTHDIKGDDGKLIQEGKMFVFTTRADTIYGVTFCAVAAEHPLATHAAKNNPALQAFVAKCKQGSVMEADMATMEKEGIKTDLKVTHPLTGEHVDVWVGNYVLMSYGDGAVMGVPAHDERDFAFAKKYDIEIKQVVALGDHAYSTDAWQDWYASKDGACIASGPIDGLSFSAAVEHVAKQVAEKGLGERKEQFRIRDWGVSRQRYWGTPIPIIHCEEHGAVPVPEQDLPVVLPEDCIPDGSGNPLHKHEGFHAGVKCPICGKAARRETDTMDTFVDSSWYFMRYTSPGSDGAMIDPRNDYWMPMDQYIGGIEHAILHLLYARFWTKVMRDIGLVKTDEPADNLLCQGMVLNHVYSRKNEKGGIEYFWPSDVENIADAEGKVIGAKLKSDGSTVSYDGVGTMSKSKNNGVDPQAIIDKYGADTARLFTMFTAPPEQTLEWNDDGVLGASRFLRRVWAFCVQHQEAIANAPALDVKAVGAAMQSLRKEIHQSLKQANYDYERIQYNTVVSACMKMTNTLEGVFGKGADATAAPVLRECVSILLRTLYPVTPHICCELWQQLGYAKEYGDLLDAPWPVHDEGALVTDQIELVVQINGKTRGHITMPSSASKEAIEAAAKSSDLLEKYAPGLSVKKIIVIPGKLVSVVAA